LRSFFCRLSNCKSQMTGIARLIYIEQAEEAGGIIGLIEKARSGDDIAFLQLFQQYEADIYRTVYLYVKNKEDALDMVQETAYRSFKSINRLREAKYFKTWLLKIAISCSMDYLRKRKRMIDADPGMLDRIAEEANEDVDLEITVQELMEALSEQERGVVVLRFYHDLTIREAAETLGMPLGTAKTVFYRALGKLRKELKRGGAYE